MSTNDELLAQMKLKPENLMRIPEAKAQFAKSKFDKTELKEKVGETVWVKCVSELKPWANNIALEFWEDYQVSVEEAIMLDERRFAVILETPSKKGE